MSPFNAEDASLEKLLQKHRDVPLESLLPEELNLLIDLFLLSQNVPSRTQSLLLLSKFSSDIRQKYSSPSSSDAATSVLVRTFTGPIEARLTDTQESATLSGLLFFAALFQIDWVSACEIFSRDGLLDAVMDAPDIYPSSQAISVAVASLLSQACGHKQCRSLVSAPQVKAWLDKSTNQTKDSVLRAAAAVALVKLSRGSEIDAQSSDIGGISLHSSKKPSESSTESDHQLVELMKKLVIVEDRPSPATRDAVEGLAYLTVQPTAKEAVSVDLTFLKCLTALVPRRSSAFSFPASHADRNMGKSAVPGFDHGLNYGIAVIISNICAYRPRLSDEEQQIERLRRMTKEPNSEGKLSDKATRLDGQDKLDDNDHVRIRGKRLMDAGAVEALTGIVKNLGDAGNSSVAAKRTVSKAFLSLVEEKANRGRVLQGGGAKTLLIIIRPSISELPSGLDTQGGVDQLDPADLLAIQALAKLSITSPPAAVFGPAQDSYVDAIRPFAFLLIHSSSSLLQRFEAVMALTNIASFTPEAAQRVSAFRLKLGHSHNGEMPVGDIVKRAETHLLDTNPMLRRASTELICNLIGGAEASFEYFGGSTGSSTKSRLQILIALSDVDDLPTRLAASGALATLTASPIACRSLANLEMERHRVLPMLVELISPETAREYREERPEDEEIAEAANGESASDPGLLHRGVVCVRNLFANLDTKDERKAMSLEAERRGLVRALVQTIKLNAGGTENGAILRPAAEVLKWIVQSGVKLPL